MSRKETSYFISRNVTSINLGFGMHVGQLSEKH